MDEFVFIMRTLDKLIEHDFNIVKENKWNNKYYIENKFMGYEYENNMLNIKTGGFIGNSIESSIFGIKNTSEFINYLRDLSNIDSELYFKNYDTNITYSYEKIKDILEHYRKIEEYCTLATEYLIKLKEVKDIYIIRYSKSRKLYKAYKDKIIKLNKWNKFCNFLLDEDGLGILTVLMWYFGTMGLLLLLICTLFMFNEITLISICLNIINIVIAWIVVQGQRDTVN